MTVLELLDYKLEESCDSKSGKTGNFQANTYLLSGEFNMFPPIHAVRHLAWWLCRLVLALRPDF